MRNRSIPVAGYIFPSKAALREACTAALNAHLPGAVLSEPIKGLFMAVLEKHPEAPEKFGTGVRRLLVGTHEVFRTRVLMIERLDGSLTDVSYRAAIDRIGRAANDNELPPPPTTTRRDFIQAARRAVREQIEAFRKDAQVLEADPNGRVRCALSGKLLPLNSCDVDHDLPWDFTSILEAFVFERGLDIKTVAVDGYEDGSTERRFSDPQLAKDFAEYHFARATLRIVERSTHRRISAEARRVSAPEHGD